MSERTVHLETEPGVDGQQVEAAMADPVGRSAATHLVGLLVSLATILAIVGLAVAVFFNPLWIGFSQDRADVPNITGYTPEQVRVATGSILWDVLIGPPTFAAEVGGEPVLGELERSHMADVHDVVRMFTAAVGFAVLAVAAIVAMNRRRAWVWRAIARGAATLILAGMVIGVAVVFFFDRAFLVFHLVFFPQGNFLFDPRIQRLTQLFPEQLFIETATALVIMGLAMAIAVALLARRAASRVAG